MQQWEKTLSATCTAQLIALMGVNFVFPFIPFYIQELGITDIAEITRWTGLLAGIPGLSMAFFAPIWGSLADRYGRKLMVERAMFGGSVLIICMGLVSNVYQLLVLRILQGVFSGTITASVTLVSATSPRKKLGFSLGLMQASVSLGSFIGPLLGGVVADFWGYRYSFYVTGSLFLIAGLIIFFSVKEDFQPLPKQEIAEKGFRKNPWIFFSSQQFLAIIVTVFFVIFARMIVYPIFPLFVQFLAKDSPRIALLTGALLASTGISSVFSSIIIGHVSDKVGYKKVLLISMAGAGIFFLPQAFTGSISQLFLWRIILGLFIGGIKPIANVIVGLSVSDRDRGKGYGIAASARALGRAFGPITGGIIASALGLRAIFIFGTALFMIVAIWTAIMLKEPKMIKKTY